MRAFLILCLLACEAGAATWYVRPGGASYGANNGTAYANAWPGLTNLVFGSVASSDTVYICGTNNDVLQQKVVPSATYRMDYAPDPGSWSNGRFWIATNTTFYGCHFFTNYPLVVNQVPSTNIVFDSCSFLYGIQMDLYYHYDYWTFRNCEIGYAPNGIYTHINGQPSGPNFLTVSNCYIHHTDVPGWTDADGHAIGVQGGSGCIITKNTTDYTGSAIEFDSLSRGCSNNVVSYNYIQNTHQAAVTGGHGIGFSADAEGFCISNRVFGNVLHGMSTNTVDNVNGYGIAFNRGDYLFVANNTISNCARGVSLTSAIAKGLIENNIVNGARQYAVSFAGQTTPGDVTVDYNLYYPANNCLIPTGTANVHSVVANPLFASASSVATAYRITFGSPAIQAGTSLGVTSDFLGRTYASPPSIGAFEYISATVAASCSQADIQAAIALSVPGDTVIVPAGNCAPTISILLTNQITLQAQGTILQDSIINTGDGANSSIIQVAVGPSPTNETRITGFTFQTGSRVTKLFDSGNIHLGGGANNVRIDHCNFLATQNIGIGGGDVFGVIDHCVFAPPGAFTQPMKLTHASYGGAANGYGSWALPSWTNSYHEDASAIYIENNFFTNSSGSSGLGIDGFGGARWVSRYNIYDRVIDGGHGTETTAQYAGCRLKDVYNNLFIEHGDSEPGHWRSGSGACASNTVISCPNQFQARNYRGAFGGFYHYANATNAWDLNDATIYAAGNATAGGTLTMTDSGQAWTPSQWIGYTIRNVSSGQGSIINASTATTVSYAQPTEGANMAFTPGQTYQFRKVVTILDEVGRGQGSLRNNAVPAWPNQVVDPVYNWANTFDGASKLMDNGGYYTSVVGQEIINGPNVNWLPYTYPHPLVTTNSPPPTPTPPTQIARVTTLRVGTTKAGP